jgi:hypothetical protein
MLSHRCLEARQQDPRSSVAQSEPDERKVAATVACTGEQLAVFFFLSAICLPDETD